jgi:hypothetical protein
MKNLHENPVSGSRVAPCRQTDRYTDMTGLIVAFLNFGNTPKNWKAIQVVGKLGDIWKRFPFELST